MSELKRLNVLGVEVSAIDMAQAVAQIEGWVQSGARQYVCVTNTFSIMECRRDPALRKLFNRAGLVTPDGMPLVWLSHLSGYPHVRRVYGPDLLLALCERAHITRHRHYFYGGSPDALDNLIQSLKRRFPDLTIAGFLSPPFRDLDEDEDREIVRKINESQPDIVWIGLGTNRQERWMADHQGQIQAGALIGVGAAFDFLSGMKQQAPRWMREHGLEWLFRLMTEPRRLWRRYLISAPLFMAMAILQHLKVRVFPVDK